MGMRYDESRWVNLGSYGESLGWCVLIMVS